jgi:site-specific recombinase XerD
MITDFFTLYLSNEAGLSENTIKSYRDTFILYFRYLDENGICKPRKLELSVFTVDNVSKFLDWLEMQRQCRISTRNQRLAALKSFSNYVIRRMPENCGACQSILRIRVKKAPQATVDYLPADAIALLMAQPDKNTSKGIRDLAILSLMYESASRVQELIDIKYGDISFRMPNTVKLTGKGNKSRVIPISSNVASIINAYAICSKRNNSVDVLFVNRRGEKLSRSGVSYILNKHMQTARIDQQDMFRKKIHPHVLRHSKAMNLLENGVNLIYIRDFLGHASVTTTETYIRCNPEIKRKYIEQSADLIDQAIEPYSDSEKEK